MNVFDSVVRFLSSDSRQPDNKPPVKQEPVPLSSFDENIRMLRSVYTNCPDVVFRDFLVGSGQNAMLIYIQNLAGVELIDEFVLIPLMNESGPIAPNELVKKLPVASIKTVATVGECVEELSRGNPLLFLESIPVCFVVPLARAESRAIDEPTAEGIVRGPREGFVEQIGLNISLLRRKIKSPELKMAMLTIGRLTRTQVAVAYMQGIADEKLVEEVMNRLRRIDIDGVLESSYIEEMIDDNTWSIFPQVLNTERPDTAASGLLEGRVVILTDGTPFALIVPITLFSLLQSAEDYYQRFYISTFTRWLRYLFGMLALLLPSFYVGILTFHQEMIPTTLLIRIARSREEVPFPALVEALLLEVTFEALREAGIRLPKQIGAAVSIVGALVIGQAAVSAGLVSAPMVMVVAITGIASFMMPRYSVANAIRLLRFPIIMLAGTLGLLGIILSIIAIVIHLCSLRSFGAPYLGPLAPLVRQDLKDTLVRTPWWSMNKRPMQSGKANLYRQPARRKPGSAGGD
ncbi:spore germination protein [Paenibacillus humicola]|uniref:spore germination protein n=1 Tax=Paenibacillus humicola TaxID=3110540 RepID=UPI00237BD913|nr:spore germination protein [Paenibacillus humicola]